MFYSASLRGCSGLNVPSVADLKAALAKPGSVCSHPEVRVCLCKHENLPVRMQLQGWGLRPSAQIKKSVFNKFPKIWSLS